MTVRLDQFDYAHQDTSDPLDFCGYFDQQVSSVWVAENDPKLGNARILVSFYVGLNEDNTVRHISSGDDGYYVAHAVNLTAIEKGDYAAAFVDGLTLLELHADIKEFPAFAPAK